MEANVFISKLKADGSKNDLTDLYAVFREYKDILAKISTKDRGQFSLNVLCILCRNLEKISSWRVQIDCKALLTLSIDCVRETYHLDTAERVKTLACIYHIHRHAVRQNAQVPPELVLKLSYMPFDSDAQLKEYCKTYWNILADRIAFIEKLKSEKVAVTKLFQKLTEDIVKVIKMYNTTQFCATILIFLVKKLHFLYNDVSSIELNKSFGWIFEEISLKNDLKLFKKLSDKELMEIYIKLNDCLYVIAENATKVNYKDSVVNTVVKTCINLLGHCPDYLHCLQTVYLNGFCSILSTESNITYTETILTNMITSCENTEKLGYVKAMNATYPYINQCLRLFIEFNVSNERKKWHKNFTEQIQNSCLKLMAFLLKKLKNCNQILKCENCSVKSGLHDGLRSSFLIKNFISISLQENMPINKILPAYLTIILHQYAILQDLCALGCSNYDKCYRKMQSDVHNTAILLNKSQNYEYSIKLFDLYLKNEIAHFKNENDLKNISRALYNKSICELDSMLYENALLDAYLSFVFAYPEGLSTEKYMSLVMDIKSKVLKSKDDDDDQDDLQMMTVLDACAMTIETKKYGNLKPFFCNLKFSELLKHEFSMYVKLWPSLVPIAGVWRTLNDLSQHDVPWLLAKDDSIQETLYDIILETPTAVRTIHNENFSEIITEIVERFENDMPTLLEQKILYGTLLFLKAEFDLAEASVKHGWKVTEPTTDPDNQPIRTISQEHDATRNATRALGIWTEIIKEIQIEPSSINLQNVLQIVQVYVLQFLHLYRTVEGLQLAHICCQLAKFIGDRESYVKIAGLILYTATKQTPEIIQIISTASKYCKELMYCACMETALVFICDCALFYSKIGLTGVSARMVQVAQAKILAAYEKNPDVNLEIAAGALLEAQCALSVAGSALAATIGAHRHYITVANTATNHTTRRLISLTLKLRISTTGVQSTTLARRILCWARARASPTAAAAPAQAAVFAAGTNASCMEDAQIKIDNRLKHILGLQPSADQPILQPTLPKKDQLFTPKQDLETMLDNLTFKKSQISPSLSCLGVPGCNIPEFLNHTLECICYACSNLFSIVLACQTIGLEASMYFRAKEVDIARNYFDGAFESVRLGERKLKKLKKDNFEAYTVEVTKDLLVKKLRNVEVDILIEAAFFELSQGNFKQADEFIVKIHEILQDSEQISVYIKNEVLNLITTSAQLRKSIRKVEEVGLETEFESLKLSPPKQTEIPKTPEAKAEKPPKITKIKAKDEEVPNRRRIIKLNLEDTEEKEASTDTSTKRVTKAEFKIPVPVTVKPVLESITPIPRRRKPDMIVTPCEPSTSIFEFATPKPNETVFSTPLNSTTEQFFTPMSTLRTYTKKSLRQNLVKNLESEFSTPKSEVKKSDKVENSDQKFDKENVSKQSKTKVESIKPIRDKRSLKRATSPGKLDIVDKKPTRSRMRQPQI